jgi:sugar phosphate permease
MWLPKPLYESIPFSGLVIGVIVLVAAFFVSEPYWPEILAAAGILGIVISLVLLLRRRGYRASRSRIDFDSRS